MDQIQPFRIEVPAAHLSDLTDRLHRTRWPEAAPVDDWSQGIPLSFVQDLCTYWANGYDWRATEAHLNGVGQYRTDIDGIGIHFLHVESPHSDALPLVITHGWPGSVVEFLKVLGPLSDPSAHGGVAQDAFHVVCPSLPGFGFSDKPTRVGWGVERIADAWDTLMARLGYDRYGAQAGDWGSTITTTLAQRHADHVMGIHLNLVGAGPDQTMLGDLTPEEQEMLATIKNHLEWGAGYSAAQSTRPQTLGYGLVDSPAGQCAWIAEKLWSWTDHDGDLYSVLTRDEVLDNVMLYWLPAAAASSARLYWESFRTINNDPVSVPVGCSQFPKEVYRASHRWAQRRYQDLRWWNELDRGGHFPAFEQPATFVEEVRSFFRTLR